MVDEDFIKKLIKDKENRTLDLKLKISSKSKIARTISAFANTDGGIILIGVADDGRLIGIDTEEEKFMILSANEEFCAPPASIKFEEVTLWTDKAKQADENEINLLLAFIQKSESGKVYVHGNGKRKAYIRRMDQSLGEINPFVKED